MKIPLSWLREYVDIPEGVDALCERLTMLGLEIESVERLGDEISGVVVGEIVTMEPHPDADRLSLCKTNVGEGEPLQIVCGATNMKVGDRVPTAVVGATLPGDFKIGRRKMRGVESQGMMCSPRELGLGDDHDGLMILDPDLPLGEDIRPLLGLNEVVLEIEVTPNRGDWAGLIGIARELAASYGTKLKLPDVAYKETGETKVADIASISIEDPDLCPRYIGRLVKGVSVGPSPDWLAKRLIAAGQRSINNVVDVTNYVLLETGQPLHAFDLNHLNEHRIVVRRAREGERMTTLDDEARALTPEMLVIADAKEPVALAGIMGGLDSEVADDTTDILVESAWFDPACIRRTSRGLNIITESSQRFQRGADIEMVDFASRRAVALILEAAGGAAAPGTLDEYPNKLESKDLALRFAETERLLGTDVSPETQCSTLVSLGFETTGKQNDSQTFSIPTWRHDVSHEADLIEEIARLYGYDTVPSTLPKVRSVEHVYAPEHAKLRALRRHLTATGLTETVHWTFDEAMAADNAGVNISGRTTVTLENPLSEKNAVMRQSLLPRLLQTVSANLRKNRSSVAVFETGPVYWREGQDTRQETRLAIALAGAAPGNHWSEATRDVDVFDLKGQLEAILEVSTAQPWDFQAADLDTYAPGAGANLHLNGNTIGSLGRVSDHVAERFDIEKPVYAAEITLTSLISETARAARYAAVSQHPPSLRDLAVVVDDAVPAGELLARAKASGGKHLLEAAVFDVYKGKPIPTGKKSVAISLTFQSPERTLTDKDTQKAVDKIVKALQHTYKAELR